MILSFSLSNYRSIRNRATLSLIPSKTCKELPDNVFSIANKFNILRSAVIYGANASGKSNLLKGLVDFIEFIAISSSKKLNNTIQIYDPYLLDKTAETQSSDFEIEFILNQSRCVYSVSCLLSQIAYESLFFYPKGQKVLVFERENNNPIKFGSVLKGEKRSIEARLLPNQLFLSKAANENLDFLTQIYLYFKDYEINFAQMGSVFDIFPPNKIIGSMLMNKNQEFINRFQQIITSLDVGIEALKIKESTDSNLFSGITPTDGMDMINQEFVSTTFPKFKYEIVTMHSVYDTESKTTENREFSIDMESSGTKNLLMLAFTLLETFEKGSVIIIDEFEKSLHPQIAKTLIQLFNNKDINKNNAQLIFTTHDVSFLNNELFRRDQIWFTEKDEFGKTELYALSQIDGIRKDIPYDKWYLSGRFGATPIVNEILIQYENAVQKRD